MSTKNVYFGAPVEIPFAQVLNAATSIPSVLDRMPETMVLLTTPPDQSVSLRWFTFASSHPSRINRDAFVESLEHYLPVLVTACHDDQNGVFLYRRLRDKCATTLLSDGDKIGIVSGEFDLAGASGSAVDVGLRADFPDEQPRAYLDVDAGPAYRLQLQPDWRCDVRTIDAASVRSAPLRAMVDFFPNASDWQRAKIPMRDY